MIHFATYSDPNFSKTKKRICNQAKDFGFDRIYSLSPEDLSVDFVKKTSPYIHQPKGGGYWLWKAFVFKHVFDKMNDDDILVYLDAGCEINPNGKQRFQDYIEFMDLNNGIFAFQMGLKEYAWTNQATFDYFEINPGDKLYESFQFVGGIIFFRKNSFTNVFINEFYNIATSRPDLFSDDYHYSNNAAYVEHRHDQSILSILRKKHGIQSMKDEAQYERWENTKGLNIPFFAKRIRDKDTTIKGRTILLLKRFYYQAINIRRSLKIFR